MVVYQGVRKGRYLGDVLVIGNGSVTYLPVRRDLFGATCDGFDWSEIGNGGSLLAYSLLAHLFDDDYASAAAEGFAADVIDALPHEGWELTLEEVHQWAVKDDFVAYYKAVCRRHTAGGVL